MRIDVIKSKLIYAICVGTIGSILCACGDEIPDMSPEKTELITDYSAALLLKYDSNTPSRLLPEDSTNVINVMLPGEQMPEIVNPNMDVSDDVIVQNTGDDTTVIDNTDSAQVEQAQVSGQGFRGFLGDSGYNIEYSQLEIVESYPEGDDANAYFAVDATSGNKLLVMHFAITNTTSEQISVDMNHYDFRYRVTVDSGKKHNVMTTLLGNDILSYKGDIGAGESVDVVAIAEIPEEEAVSLGTVVFYIKGNANGENVTDSIVLQ